jgi:putative addiction module killer protein
VRVQEYVRPDGSNPYKRWFESLDSQAAAKVAVAIYRLELGNTSSIKWFSGIGECKIDWGPGYRIYVAKVGSDLILLLGGGTKKSQQTDIDIAKQLLVEYKQPLKTKPPIKKGKEDK